MSTGSKRRSRVLLAAALLSTLTVVAAPSAHASESDLVMIGTGIGSPSVSVGSDGRWVAAGVQAEIYRAASGSYVVIAACVGSAGPDAASTDLTCTAEGGTNQATFPGGAAALVANGVSTDNTMGACSYVTADYVLAGPRSASSCIWITVTSDQVIQVVTSTTDPT